MRSPHKTEHAVCPNGATTWGECDKVRDRAYGQWQAFQTVLLAYRIALSDNVRAWKKDHTVFGQLVRQIAGEQDTITGADGQPSHSPEVKRLMAAIERFKAGDFPSYNLYEIPAPVGSKEA